MNPSEERAFLATQPAALEAAKGPIEIHGNPGWEYSIKGSGFGTAGSLTIKGIAIPTERWDDENVRGHMPIGAKGEILLTPSRGKLLKNASGDNPAEYAPAPPQRKGVYDPDTWRSEANKKMAAQAVADKQERMAAGARA